MKIIKLALLLLSSSIVLTGCGANNGNVVLKINDVKITRSQFNKALLGEKKEHVKNTKGKFDISQSELRKLFASGTIQATLIHQEMIKRNLTASEEEIKQARKKRVKMLGSEEAYLEMLKLNNLNAEQEKENLTYFVKLEKLINIVAKPKVTDGEIKKYYNDHKQDFYEPEKIKFSQIFLKTNYAAVKNEILEEDKKSKLSIDEIDKLSREIVTKNEELLNVLISKVNTSNFSEIAKVYSQDPKSAKNGGDMGFVTMGDISNILYGELSIRKVGEIGPAVETAKGSHIVLVKDKSAAMYHPIENVRADIEARILNDKREENYQKMLDGLMANADIVIYDKTLKKDYVNPIEAFFNKFKKRK